MKQREDEIVNKLFTKYIMKRLKNKLIENQDILRNRKIRTYF